MACRIGIGGGVVVSALKTSDELAGSGGHVPIVSVSQRFSVGHMMVAVGLFAMLFSLLEGLGVRELGDPILVYPACMLFCAAIPLGQVLLYQGRRPRLASCLVGARLLPPLALLPVLIEVIPDFGWLNAEEIVFLGFQLVFGAVLLSGVGYFLGYLIGTVSAGVFLVLDRRWDAGKRISGESEDPESVNAIPREVSSLPPTGWWWFDWIAWSPAVWLWKGRHRPWRNAIVVTAAATVLLLVGLLFAWRTIPWPLYLAATAVVAPLIGLAVSGLGLAPWRLTLTLSVAGVLASAYPMHLMSHTWLWRQVLSSKPPVGVVAILFGAVLGLAAAGVCGWATRWLEHHEIDRGRYRYVALGTSALALFLAPTGFAYWYVNSSRECAIREIGSTGGEVMSIDPFCVTHAQVDAARVSEGFFEDLGTLTDLISLELENAKLTREHARAFEGLTGLRILIFEDCRFEKGATSELPPFPALDILTFNGTGLRDDDLILLRNCPSLRHLAIVHESLQGTGLKDVAGLKRLNSIMIQESEIGRAAFQHMRQISQIVIRCVPIKDDDIEPLAGSTTTTNLNLISTNITDRGLQYLGNLPNLDVLVLAESRVRGFGLPHLKGLENLSFLDLSGSLIDDEGLVRMPRLPGLMHLSLADTKITGRGLEHLKVLPALRRLDLSRCQLGDGDLAALRELTLYELNLDETQVTDEAKAELMMYWQRKEGEDFPVEIGGWIGQ